jgi:hypothetical protein
MKIKEINWKTWHKTDTDVLIGFVLPEGDKLSVLDRLTGYGDEKRDIETGYRDKSNLFWLASGNFDIREYGELSINEAINFIKRNANTCVGV